MADEVLPADGIGTARPADGFLDVGGVKVPVPVGHGEVPACVRRSSSDRSVVEVLVAFHDGPAQEELDARNAEAERHPSGPEEYRRFATVGRYGYGAHGHPTTDEEFEQECGEGRAG